MMESFEKITPEQKRILGYLANLQPYEYLKVMADKYGRPNTFIVVKTSKVLISGESLIHLKVTKEEVGD